MLVNKTIQTRSSTLSYINVQTVKAEGDAKIPCYQSRESLLWNHMVVIYTLNCSYLCQQKYRRLKMSTLMNSC